MFEYILLFPLQNLNQVKGNNKIKSDPNNFRLHSDDNKELIAKSITELGAGRSILLDSDNSIIAGNGVYEQWLAKGGKIKIIESDGTELIAVKRVDIDPDTDKRHKMAIVDNAANDLSKFDATALSEQFDADFLDDWGVDMDIINIEDVDLDDFFVDPKDNNKPGIKRIVLEYSNEEYNDLIHIINKRGLKCNVFFKEVLMKL